MNDEAPEFCDTNIVVYAYDPSAREKYVRARSLLDRLWQSGTGAISVQVLQELFVTLTRKLSARLAPAEALGIVSDLAAWEVVEPTRRDVLEAIDLSIRWGISFWDAMVLFAAKKAGASVVWSEDLQSGRSYDGVLVRNPFEQTERASPEAPGTP